MNSSPLTRLWRISCDCEFEKAYEFVLLDMETVGSLTLESLVKRIRNRYGFLKDGDRIIFRWGCGGNCIETITNENDMALAVECMTSEAKSRGYVRSDGRESLRFYIRFVAVDSQNATFCAEVPLTLMTSNPVFEKVSL